MKEMSGQGWHNDPYEHDLARQGVKTKKPVITETEAQQIVAKLRNKSPSHQSQENAQTSWYEDAWIRGELLKDDKLAGQEVETLQEMRKRAEELKTNAASDSHKSFYGRQIEVLKETINEKLRKKQEELQKQRDELSGW
jgi:hypothetical protein